MLGVLARKIESSQDVFNSQVVSNCLYGMTSFSSRHEAVRYLLSVVRHKIELSGAILQAGESMSAQGVGNALYGLKGMSSEWLEVGSSKLALHIVQPIPHPFLRVTDFYFQSSVLTDRCAGCYACCVPRSKPVVR